MQITVNFRYCKEYASFSIWLYAFSAGSKVLDVCAMGFFDPSCSMHAPIPYELASEATMIFNLGSK